MGKVTISFEVDEQLGEAFAAAAAAGGPAGEDLLRAYMAEIAERGTETAAYDAWFRTEVEQALREAEDPDAQFIPHADVMRDARHALEARIAAKHGLG